MAKIYDCFLLYNELDLLEIRLTELYDHVDHFVLLESTVTFQGKPKSLFYDENKERFSKFADKIIHIIIDDQPSPWKRFFFRRPHRFDIENHQREGFSKVINKVNPDDIVILSDLDEIPNPSLLKRNIEPDKFYIFEQNFCCFYLNNLCTFLPLHEDSETQQNKNGYGLWRASVMTQKKNITTFKDLRIMRSRKSDKHVILGNGGWHFTYMGGVDMVLKKLSAFSHTEKSVQKFNTEELMKDAIEQNMLPFAPEISFDLKKISELPAHFPKWLIEQKDKYKHLFSET